MRFRYLVAPFPGVLLPAVVLGIVVWTVQGGASRQYSIGRVLRESGLPALTSALTKQRKPGTVSSAKPNPEVQAKLAEAYGTLPLSFEANRGQADRNVKFLSRSHGGTWFLTPTEAVLSLWDAGAERGARNPEQAPAVRADRSDGRQAGGRQAASPGVLLLSYRRTCFAPQRICPACEFILQATRAEEPLKRQGKD